MKTILCGKSVLEYPIFHVVLPTTANKLIVETFAKGRLMKYTASAGAHSNSIFFTAS